MAERPATKMASPWLFRFSVVCELPMFKKRLAKEELLNRDYPPVWSDFSMEVVDKTILMSDFGFKK